MTTDRLGIAMIIYTVIVVISFTLYRLLAWHYYN